MDGIGISNLLEVRSFASNGVYELLGSLSIGPKEHSCLVVGSIRVGSESFVGVVDAAVTSVFFVFHARGCRRGQFDGLGPGVLEGNHQLGIVLNGSSSIVVITIGSVVITPLLLLLLLLEFLDGLEDKVRTLQDYIVDLLQSFPGCRSEPLVPIKGPVGHHSGGCRPHLV